MRVTHIAAALAMVASMTLNTAAFASGSWYLLIPPKSAYNPKAQYLAGYKILDGAPLSKWHQQAAYDSAAECENMKNSLTVIEQKTYSKGSDQYLAALGENKPKALLENQRSHVEFLNANVEAFMSSKCI